eukprot:NODE_22275_length_714_cov_9.846678.p1 GENE.NODE_22275_length_714_cov_9.846678~~NODE_22275_length_714_cov_9.846678.p1  ORF type:complete len:228 (+),score=36.53 NODE_22275_length_714_cov_9.846678:3-686(+)
MNVFRAFREWAKEDLIVRGSRRYPLTGGLRKKALTIDMEAIFPVLAKLHSHVGSPAMSDVACAVLDAPSARCSDPPLNGDDEMSAVFKEYLERPSASSSDPPPVDDDEMPPEFLGYFAARPLNPSAKRRKAAVVDGRQHGGSVDTAPLLVMSCQVCITKEDRPRAEMHGKCSDKSRVYIGTLTESNTGANFKKLAQEFTWFINTAGGMPLPEVKAKMKAIRLQPLAR